MSSNAAWGVTKRLVEVTGIGKANLDYFPIRFKDEDEGSTPKIHPFALLSKRVERLLGEDESFFELHLESTRANTVASSFTNSPLYREHPLVRECVPSGVTVLPLSFYSDGISIASKPHEDTLYTIYVSFLHRTADENAKHKGKHVYTCFRKSQMTADTLNDILDIMLWELFALAQGRRPKRGEETKPSEQQEAGDYLNGNWGRWHKMCLMQIKADCAWYAEAMGVRQWNACKSMCPWCGADRDGHLTWHNFALDAPWYGTCRTHQQFLQDIRTSIANNFRIHVAPFAFYPRIANAPFFSWEMVMLDWMHDADMGVIPAEIGEIWWSLLPRLATDRRFGRVRPSGLKALKGRLRRWYRAHKTKSQIPVNRLTLRKIKGAKSPHPKLKAKAAQARYLVPFTLALADEFRMGEGEFGEERYQSISFLSRICELANQKELSGEELVNWRLWSAYHMYFYARCEFHIYPKHHWFMHFPAQIERSGVPRGSWVYSEESKNAQIKRLWEVCSKGHSVEQQILLRLEWQAALSIAMALK